MAPQTFHLTTNNGNLISSWGREYHSLYADHVKNVNHGVKYWALDSI